MNILKNYLYNVSYQLTVIILPIILIPYISRVFEVDGIGRYSLSAAIVNYFVLFGVLGINTYGSRQISFSRDNALQLSSAFWEIFYLKLITMSISIVFFGIYISQFVSQDNVLLYFVQIFTLLAALIDISWFLFGLEEFKNTAMRNIAVKVVSIVLIFVFVNEKNDIWLYALITAGSTFIGQILVWRDVFKRIYYVKPKISKLGFHLKNTLLLWVPTLAIQVYSSLDKVMLGYITNEIQVGLYENSQKLVRIAATVTTALSTVILPRVANSFINNDIAQIRIVSNRSFAMISMVVFPMGLGIMSVRETLVPWFFGPGYEEIIELLCISGWLIISLGWSSVFGAQILIGCHKEKQFTIAVTIGAIINIILNSLLIINFKAAGAIFASVVAEYIGMLVMLFFVRKIINIREIFKPIPLYLISSVVMYIIVYYCGRLFSADIIATIIQLIVGVIVYVGILIIFRDENIDYIGSKISAMVKRN